MISLFRRSPPPFRDFALPSGQRAYAIGDVHGCLSELEHLLALIEQDDRSRPPVGRTELIFLGDLIDRGPASAGVVERVARLAEGSDRVHLILGNHEEVFLAAARGDAKSAKLLLGIGGYATLESYGIDRDAADHGGYDHLASLLLDRIPRGHVDFLASGRDWLQRGDYVFAHAGIRPGKALERQSLQDLRWIREPFLSATRDDGTMVIHGHTPTADVDARDDRLGIDTGAYMSGVLTAVGIEGRERWFLQTPPRAESVTQGAAGGLRTRQE